MLIIFSRETGVNIYINSRTGYCIKRVRMCQETWVPSLGWEDLLEKEMAPQSSILAWRIPRQAWQTAVHWVAKESDTTEWLKQQCGIGNEYREGREPGWDLDPERQQEWRHSKRKYVSRCRDVARNVIHRNKWDLYCLLRFFFFVFLFFFFIKYVGKQWKWRLNGYDRAWYLKALIDYPVPSLELDLHRELWSVSIFWMECFSIWRVEWVGRKLRFHGQWSLAGIGSHRVRYDWANKYTHKVSLTCFLCFAKTTCSQN